MNRSNDEGVSDCSANPLKTYQIPQRNSAIDDERGKSLATMQPHGATGCRAVHDADGALIGPCAFCEVPCLRAVGNLLRRIGGAA